ncbi:MAG: hypothetical protein ACOCWC_04905 [Bacteroidota bacterium]
MEQADIMGGMKQGKVHALPKQVMMVSYTHACVKYVESLLEYSRK